MSDHGVQYHRIDSCNKCGGLNRVTFGSEHTGEASTKCTECGFEDYWAYGYFESGGSMESNCATYSFGEG